MTSKPTQDTDTDQSIKKTFTFYGKPIPITILCTALCIFWTIMLANNWSLLVTTFSRFFGPYSAQITFNQLFLTCSIFFVWKMKIVGRIMVSIWCVINLVGNFLTLRIALETYNSDTNNQIFPAANPTEFIIPMVFLFGLIYYINRKKVRVLFK